MLESGFSIKKSLEVLANSDAVGGHAENVLESYTSGIDFIDALIEEDIFNEEVEVILKSSASKNLVKGLKESLRWLNMEMNFKRSARSAIIYPSILVFVSHIVFYIILIVVVPRLEKGIIAAVKEKGIFLSAYIYLSHHVLAAIVINLLLLGLIFILFKTGVVYKVLIRLPGIAKALKIRASAMFFTILSILIDAGVHLTEALRYATNVKGFEKYQDDIETIQETGIEQFFETLYEDGKYDVVTKMSVITGITSGNFDAAVRNVAQKESLRFEEMQKNLSKVIEPLAVAVTVATVAFLITPLYSSILNAVFSSMDKM
jgi:type IV pilus assembly protein PilC